MLTLNAEKREKVSKVENRKMREEGKIPAVFYGTTTEATPISISASDFKKVWKEAGESSIIALAGVGDERNVLIHDVDVDPVKGHVRHADFYVVEKGKKLQVSVPLEFIGEAPAIKSLGGILTKVLHEVEIEVLPQHLPQHLEVDISSLDDFEKQIQVKDILLPEGVELLAESDEVVALVAEAKEEEEEEPQEIDMASIQVEKRGKEEAEEGETKEEE
ncbi:MAG: 50S ribosomal protein L25 [Candidatus Paceibacterota bacterium]